MDLREKIARAICGNWVVGDDRPWRVWLEEADAVLEVLRQQKPVAWMCSSEALLRMGYQKFSTTCGGDWNIPVYAGHQGPQAAVPDGWQLVPIEPTNNMLRAACVAWTAGVNYMDAAAYRYRAMLAAAPKPEERR